MQSIQVLRITKKEIFKFSDLNMKLRFDWHRNWVTQCLCSWRVNLSDLSPSFLVCKWYFDIMNKTHVMGLDGTVSPKRALQIILFLQTWRNVFRRFCFMCVFESMLQVVSLHWESLVVKHWQQRPNLRTCPNMFRKLTRNPVNRCMKNHVLWLWALLDFRVLLTKTKAITNRFTRRDQGILGCRQSRCIAVIQCALARLAGIFGSSSKWGQTHWHHFWSVEFPMFAGCWKSCRS